MPLELVEFFDNAILVNLHLNRGFTLELVEFFDNAIFLALKGSYPAMAGACRVF